MILLVREFISKLQDYATLDYSVKKPLSSIRRELNTLNRSENHLIRNKMDPECGTDESAECDVV